MVATLSVIIPTYNRARQTWQAVRSVKAQRMDGIEIIVVDDGSTDGTSELLAREFPDIVLLRQEQRGVSAARNLGIEKAEAPLIALLDSDDLFLPAKSGRQCSFLLKHLDIPLVHSDEHWLRNGRFLRQGPAYRRGGGDQFERSLERCVISPSSVTMRRDLVEEVGLFDESMPACEDYDLWLRVTVDHPVGHIPEPLLIKRGGHGDQLSRTVPALDYWRIFALLKLLKQAPLREERRGPILEALVEKCRIMAEGRRKRGRNDDSFFEELPDRCSRGEIPDLPPLT